MSDGDERSKNSMVQMDIEEKNTQQNDPESIRHLKKMFYLSIAYSANIGGTSTLTSNGPNLILRFVVDS